MTDLLSNIDPNSRLYVEPFILFSGLLNQRSATWVGCPVSGLVGNALKGQASERKADPRAMVALARVNWLHSRYKIVCANSLYLYHILANEGLKE